jgi:hypothetical protein
MTDEARSEEAILGKILKDPIFYSGDFYKELLRYLHKCHCDNYSPTEIDIATHVFGKKHDFDPAQDTLIRVYLFRLRKKFEKYYKGPGRQDPIRISIPKGSHSLEFVPNSDPTTEKSRRRFSLPRLACPLAFVFLTAAILYLWMQNASLKKLAVPERYTQDNFIWSDFLKSNLPTVTIFGELFSFYKHLPEYDRTWLVRDDQINSHEELDAFVASRKIERGEVFLPGWDILPKSAVLDFSRIQPLFHPRERRLQARITSEFLWKDLESSNIIYIGHFHNLGLLKSLLPQNRIQSVIKRHRFPASPEYHIRVHAGNLDTLYQTRIPFMESEPPTRDFVIVTKIPGPKTSSILFIVSYFTSGRSKAIENLTDLDALRQLQDRIRVEYPSIPAYFEMMLEVEGYKETGLKMELKHFFPLPSDFRLYE